MKHLNFNQKSKIRLKVKYSNFWYWHMEQNWKWNKIPKKVSCNEKGRCHVKSEAANATECWHARSKHMPRLMHANLPSFLLPRCDINKFKYNKFFFFLLLLQLQNNTHNEMNRIISSLFFVLTKMLCILSDMLSLSLSPFVCAPYVKCVSEYHRRRERVRDMQNWQRRSSIFYCCWDKNRHWHAYFMRRALFIALLTLLFRDLLNCSKFENFFHIKSTLKFAREKNAFLINR